MQSSSSSGLHNIDSKILTLSEAFILPSMMYIVNLSIATQTFPSDWKIAKIVPIHKKEDVTLPANYRPVSLLSSISKVAEWAVYLQLVSYFETNKLIPPAHHGFRAGHSTTTALIQMQQQWLDGFDKGEISALLALDMSAAFDLVLHKILLEKIQLYTADKEGTVVNWLKSYLSGRKQVVSLEGALSEELEVKHGVPQGSILGPLLYIIYTNDLPEAIHSHTEPDLIVNCRDCGLLSCYADKVWGNRARPNYFYY